MGSNTALFICLALVLAVNSLLWDFIDHIVLSQGRLLHPLWLVGSVLCIVLGVAGAFSLLRRCKRTGVLK